MIYNYTSSKQVIAKVFTDNDLQEGTHRISDMVEWLGEGLEKIGAYAQYIPKVMGKGGLPLLEVSNYQARLPFDFHRLGQMIYCPEENGPYYPMRRATGSTEKEVGTVTTSSTDVEEVADRNGVV